MAEPTAFEERMFDDKTTFPSFTLCPAYLEEFHTIESFEDVATEIQFAKSKYKSMLRAFESKRGEG